MASLTHENFISTELSRYRPLRGHRYSSVNVLLVQWKDDDIGVSGELEELAKLFRGFSFLVWPYRIPSENSQAQFQSHVAQFINNCGSDKDGLIILYYSGHGGRTVNQMSSECVWSA